MLEPPKTVVYHLIVDPVTYVLNSGAGVMFKHAFTCATTGVVGN